MSHTVSVKTDILQEILHKLDAVSRDVKAIKTHTVENIPMVDEETEKRIGESLKDIQAGRFTVLKSKKDIEDYLTNLSNNV